MVVAVFREKSILVYFLAFEKMAILAEEKRVLNRLLIWVHFN